MKLTDFASELQKRMPEGVTIGRVENRNGVLRGLAAKGSEVQYFTALLDGPPSDVLVERVAERILVALQ